MSKEALKKCKQNTCAPGQGLDPISGQIKLQAIPAPGYSIEKGYGAMSCTLAVVESEEALSRLLNASGSIDTRLIKSNLLSEHAVQESKHITRLALSLSVVTEKKILAMSDQRLEASLKAMLPKEDPSTEEEMNKILDAIHYKFGSSYATCIHSGKKILVIMTIQSKSSDQANKLQASLSAKATPEVDVAASLGSLKKTHGHQNLVDIRIIADGVKPPPEYENKQSFSHVVDDILKLIADDTTTEKKAIEHPLAQLEIEHASIALLFPPNLNKLRTCFIELCKKALEAKEKLQQKKNQVNDILEHYFAFTDSNTFIGKSNSPEFVQMERFRALLIDLKRQLKQELKEIKESPNLSALSFEKYHALAQHAETKLREVLPKIPPISQLTLINNIDFNLQPWIKLTPLIGRRRRLCNEHFSLQPPAGTENLVLRLSNTNDLQTLRESPISLKRRNRYTHEILSENLSFDESGECTIALEKFYKTHPDNPFEGVYFASSEESDPRQHNITTLPLKILIFAQNPRLLIDSPFEKKPNRQSGTPSMRYVTDQAQQLFAATNNNVVEFSPQLRGRRNSDLSTMVHLPHPFSAPGHLQTPARHDSEPSSASPSDADESDNGAGVFEIRKVPNRHRSAARHRTYLNRQSIFAPPPFPERRASSSSTSSTSSTETDLASAP